MRAMPARGFLAAILMMSMFGCGGHDTPSPPSTGGSSDEIQLSAGDRLGWSQLAPTLSELNTFQFAIYVDGVRSVLTGVSCNSSAAATGFECTSALPNVSIGSHTLELATFIDEGGIQESARSSPLRVSRRSLTSSSGEQIDPSVITADQVHLELQLIVDELTLPTDLAFTPDGSVLVAERRGTVRVVRDGLLLPRAALDISADISLPEGGLLALAVDPAFAENRLIYTLAATASRGNDSAFTLSRYRDIADTFGERAILFDRLTASPRGANGALRIGPDQKLYPAFDDGGNSRAASGLGSWNGKVLRLNVDATTPRDQGAASPVYAVDHRIPRALDWQPATGELWIVDAIEPSSGRLTAVKVDNIRQQRATIRAQYDLPAGTGATSATFYDGTLIPAFRGNLFVAAETGRHLIRLAFDPHNPERIISAERLLQNQIGAIRVVSRGPDQALYICTDTALFRLGP